MNHYDTAAAWQAAMSELRGHSAARGLLDEAELNVLITPEQLAEFDAWQALAARPGFALELCTSEQQSHFGGHGPEHASEARADFLCRLDMADSTTQLAGLPPHGVLDVWLSADRDGQASPLFARFEDARPEQQAPLQRSPFHNCPLTLRPVPLVDAFDEAPRDAGHRPCPAPNWTRDLSRSQGAALDAHQDRARDHVRAHGHLLLPGWSVPLLEAAGDSLRETHVPLLRIEDDPQIGTKLGTITLYLLASAEELREGRIEGLRSFQANA